jgi:hypothetical protein
MSDAMTDRTHIDSSSRARAKQAARADDERLMASGEKSVAQLKRENEAFAPLARSARVNLSASRSLS